MSDAVIKTVVIKHNGKCGIASRTTATTCHSNDYWFIVVLVPVSGNHFCCKLPVEIPSLVLLIFLFILVYFLAYKFGQVSKDRHTILTVISQVNLSQLIFP